MQQARVLEFLPAAREIIIIAPINYLTLNGVLDEMVFILQWAAIKFLFSRDYCYRSYKRELLVWKLILFNAYF